MNTLHKIFGTSTPIIGVIHLSPLIGYKGFDGIGNVLKRALFDLEAFERGGIHGIIVENNYDVPHKIIVEPETTTMMMFIIKKISERTRLPLGVSVLWNDYRSALTIAKAVSAQFIRIPVFVDRVRTDFGDITGNPAEVLAYRKAIGGEDIALFTDIQVKHAELLEKKQLSVSAQQAVVGGSDALIVTGEWTGHAPALDRLEMVREAVSNFPILVGSGATKENIKSFLQVADGVIASTSLKTGSALSPNEERNIKSFQERIDLEKVREFMSASRS